LARRDYSQHDISQKLKAKGHTHPDIALIISDLAKAGLINDARFAENFIRWRRAKGYGPLRISMELKAHGIIDEMITEYLEISDNAWFDDAHTIWRKHFKGNKPTDFKHRAKQMRFLQYRGFTREQIEYALGEIIDLT
jgi:regulatory protein